PQDLTTETDQTTWSFDLQQTLFNTDQWRRVRAASTTAAQAGVDYEVARQDLIIRVAEAYFNVLAAQDTLASEQAALEAIGRQLEQAERRFEVGLIAITDVKESQAAFDDSTALEIAARRSLASAKEALREVTGEYPDTLASPAEEFPLIPPEPAVEQDWVDIALQQNAALESAKLGVEISRESVRIARGNRLPTLSLDAQVGNFDSERDITDNATNTFLRTNKVDQDNKQVGISVNVPIFTGGGVSSAVQEQVYLHRASRENYEKVARNTERETRDAYLGVIAEISRVRALARSVESNQTALEATEAGYDVGTRTTVDVLAARDSLLKAQTLYARSKYDYLINVLKLKEAAGILSAADVADINTWLDNSATQESSEPVLPEDSAS
ncbi:MAG: TolC family outer membrane protein, partial [Gammaproteobacteria bacterium]|nr:TolC family outer membrane protein [Gammaproteobacteria bacterium]